MRVPIRKSAFPSVAQPRDPSANSDSITPDHKNEQNVGYCNILPPAPRSQLVNYPPRSTMCPKIDPKGYTKDSCYLVNNVDQGVVGLVCNNAGEAIIQISSEVMSLVMISTGSVQSTKRMSM